MQVFHELKELDGIAIALGFFDGVHIGHKKILTTLIQEAKNKGVKAAVITFDKNPADYFSEEPTLALQSFKDKELIMDSLGIDYLFELNFEPFKDLSAQEYLENILIKNFKPSVIVVGFNHTFGKDKDGNPALLKNKEKELGYECVVVPEQKYNDEEEVSSSIIRKRVQHGHLHAVKALLGRYFSVRNSVIKGKGKAKDFGCPTANLIWPNSMVKLPYGVYHGYSQANGKMYPALISWGQKPTLTDGSEEVLEVHLYDLDENIYGKIIKVIFVEKIRDQKDFGNVEALKDQIKKDFIEFKKWARSIRRR